MAAFAVFALLGAACAATAAGAVSTQPAIMPHLYEVNALYVIDHSGRNPRNNVPLKAYSREFEQILQSCKVKVEDLTNLMIMLADKASELGARHVSSLMMMQAITRRISWTSRKVCWQTFDNAEGHMEAGGP